MAGRTGEDLAQALGDFFRAEGPPGVVAAWLFGSHAAGRAHRNSDVDVGVLLRWESFSSAPSRFDERVRLLAALIAALHEDAVDLVVLNDAPPLLVRRIVTEGRRVYCADHDAERAFRVQVLSRAADIAPFLERLRRLTLEALGR